MVQNMTNWFEVDKEGFKALQLGKPKEYAVRELIQNALDEKITTCVINTSYSNKIATISVTDDGEGFKDIKDAYTLFADTYKRPDPSMRGRFNMGEKQAFAICRKAMIETTCGTIIFDKDGRHRKKTKRKIGTQVIIEINMTKDEYNRTLDFINTIISPEHIEMILNNAHLAHPVIANSFQATLNTELLKGKGFTSTMRKTLVTLYKPNDVAYLYEMGIPICKIECDYSIDVNQRVPMGIDRDKVSQAYIQDLYAEVLNNTYDEIVTEDNASSNWIRIATSDTRISKEVVETVINERYGDKVLIATVKDSLSIDDAKSEGYRIVYGSEMSKEEWNNIRQYNLLQSTSDKFGRGFCQCDEAKRTDEMLKVEHLAEKIAYEIIGIHINVRFLESKHKTPRATFGNNELVFYVSQLSKNFFDNPLDRHVLDLIIHELGHYGGHHTEIGYHNMLTKLGADMTLLALNDPEFFMDVVQ